MNYNVGCSSKAVFEQRAAEMSSFCLPTQQGKVKKSIDNSSRMRYTVYRIENKTKTIQTPLVVIYAALNFSKSINHKSNKQQFDRGVFSFIEKYRKVLTIMAA